MTAILFSVLSTNAQNKNIGYDCSAKLEKDVLTIENSKISRIFKWNNGNLITRSLTDKVSGKDWKMNSNKPDLTIPGEPEIAENGKLTTRFVPETAISTEHMEVEITYALGSLGVKRVFRIYPYCASIACDLYYRGVSNSVWIQSGTNLADMVNIEKLNPGAAVNNVPVIEKLELPDKHWKLEAVEFADITDRNNTLVFPVNALSYRTNFFKGNILFASNNVSEDGVYILKEAPTSNVQLDYSGSDFIAQFGTLRMIGAGISPSDLTSLEWRRGYGFVTGVYSGNENNKYLALREYQKKIRIHKAGRDEMIMANTWGDRSQDSRVKESFALAELESGAKLGVTHLQLDDGWQTGRSGNSAFKGGTFNSIWDRTDYWTPDSVKFPHGLAPLIKRAKELSIEICLWFNPSRDNGMEHWEKDANVLIGLYKKYGIRIFKIDGVNLPTKIAEINFRNFLDKILEETENKVVFNLDVTAGRRGGYHYLNEYGNIFLENRYTDWQNYYPYTTLRNLWMLSKYVPAENLQIEFLNKWRNQSKYDGDPFGPANYSFDYLFAITMAAQPLAWFETSSLPEEAIAQAGPVMLKYRTIQHDFHSGNIFPIGDEPSGKSWTGFQSIQDGKGYFLVFRETNNLAKAELKTWLPAGTSIKCSPVVGKGKAFMAKVGTNGIVSFELAEKNSYVLYQYTLNK
ncbi:MAG: alpha-galactosidase [Prolixibacteraceae bacterium]